MATASLKWGAPQALAASDVCQAAIPQAAIPLLAAGGPAGARRIQWRATLTPAQGELIGAPGAARATCLGPSMQDSIVGRLDQYGQHLLLQGVSQPPRDPQVPPARFGFNENAERLNSRACMVGGH